MNAKAITDASTELRPRPRPMTPAAIIIVIRPPGDARAARPRLPRSRATRARACFASSGREPDEPKGPDEADEHQEEVLPTVVDELVLPVAGNEKCGRETDHAGTR
jgi:hypothetical protein